jgi:hypothetical protein
MEKKGPMKKRGLKRKNSHISENQRLNYCLPCFSLLFLDYEPVGPGILFLACIGYTKEYKI